MEGVALTIELAGCHCRGFRFAFSPPQPSFTLHISFHKSRYNCYLAKFYIALKIMLATTHGASQLLAMKRVAVR